jgi:hypothetical protein
MKSISDVRYALQTHSAGLSEHRWNPAVVTAIWNKLQPIRTMPKRRGTYRKRSLRGGAGYALQGADLNYTMTPGSVFTTTPTVAVYDRFPIDPTVNPQVVSDLDVFFGSALSRGCGVENTVPQVPADMGSNQVGGKRKTYRKHRMNLKGGASLLPGLWDGAKDSGESIAYHPYVGTAFPNAAHSATFAWQGRESIPASGDPSDHTWNYATDKPLEPTVTTTATALGPSQFLMSSWPTKGPSPAGGARRKSKSSKSKSKSKSKSSKSKSKSKTRKTRKSYKNRK